MKVSLNIIESLVNFELPPIDELMPRLNAQLGGVEGKVNLGEKYGAARIVRVVECAKHPDADRLSVVKIDDGGAQNDVPRDENGLVQVVCGAPNVHADMWAIWLPPGAVVPASFDDEPFVLDARKLRGVLSQGMLAAGDELGLNDDHDGIIEIAEHDAPRGAELKAGASFAEVFGLSGWVIDFENKMFTHRPDCFGQLGVAREIAGILGQKFTSPDWYEMVQEFAPGDGSLELTVKNEAPELVPRFMVVAIKNVEIKPSPLWLQCQLVAMGGRAINNIVDATNYVMLMTAQPTHAYDYDKLQGHQLTARMARAGETVTLLNDKTYELDTDDIVIADGAGVIGLGGIMGGGNSEVSSSTKNIVLECANFDMYAVRKTAMRHGVFTDALTRFNKGQSPLQNAAVLKQLMGMVGGEQASGVVDCCQDGIFDRKEICNKAITPTFIFSRLGTRPDNVEVKTLLENVEIAVKEHTLYSRRSLQSAAASGDIRVSTGEVKQEEDALYIEPPFWRTDLELPEDIVEEVGRLYGFDKLPRELPRRSMLAAPKNPRREIKQKIRDSLSRAGANEVLTYSFVHENVLKKAEQDASQAFKLSNALSPDLQYYRLTVLPSLLDKIHANIKAGHDEFCLFEIGKGHDVKNHGADNLPGETDMVDLVYASKKARDGAPFYRMQRLVAQLAHDLGLTVSFEAVDQLKSQAHKPFDVERSAYVVIDGERVGLVGELKQSVIKNFKLPPYVASATLDVVSWQHFAENAGNNYCPLSRFPSTSRDISLRAANSVSYADLQRVVQSVVDETANDISAKIEPRAIFQPANNQSTKTTTFRITFTSYNRTLTDAQVKPIIDRVATLALAQFDAECV